MNSLVLFIVVWFLWLAPSPGDSTGGPTSYRLVVTCENPALPCRPETIAARAAAVPPSFGTISNVTLICDTGDAVTPSTRCQTYRNAGENVKRYVPRSSDAVTVALDVSGSRTGAETSPTLLRTLLSAFLAIPLTCITDVHVAPLGGTPPNVLFLLADDLGYGDVGYQSCETLGIAGFKGQPCTNAKVTPHIDALSRGPSTLVFSRFYAPPQCSPSRHTFITGRETTRDPCVTTNNKNNVNGDAYLSTTNETTLSDVLSSTHRTIHFGKWHLSQIDDDINPSSYGFQEFLSTERHLPTVCPNCRCFPPYNSNQYDTSSPSSPITEGHYATSYFKAEYALVNGGDKFSTPFPCSQYYQMTNTTSFDNYNTPILGEDSTFIADQFIDFLDRWGYSGKSGASPSKPFLAFVWFHAPHAPFLSSSSTSYSPYRDLAATLVQQLKRPMPLAKRSKKKKLGYLCGSGFDSPLRMLHKLDPCIQRPGMTFSKCAELCYEVLVDYHNALLALDASVGRILDEVEKRELNANTIIVFGSDNGAARHGNDGIPVYVGPGSAAGFAGFKYNTLEGGIRVPFIIRYDAWNFNNMKIAQDAASSTDLFPTILRMLGSHNYNVTVPLDGISLWNYAVLFGQEGNNTANATGSVVTVKNQFRRRQIGIATIFQGNYRSVFVDGPTNVRFQIAPPQTKVKSKGKKSKKPTLAASSLDAVAAKVYKVDGISVTNINSNANVKSQFPQAFQWLEEWWAMVAGGCD